MFKDIKNNKAQAIAQEYVFLFFVVVAFITGMSIYFKRSIQARMRDARNYMVRTVRVNTDGYYNGVLYYEYEPYYSNSVSNVVRDMDRTEILLPGGSSGIYRQFLNDKSGVQSHSVTAPPKDTD